MALGFSIREHIPFDIVSQFENMQACKFFPEIY
jgi:hypothetical protein